MKIFRFAGGATGRAASKKPCVVIISDSVSDSKAEGLKERFPGSLMIAEARRDTPAREGWFSVLRIHYDELTDYDYELRGCRAVLVEGVPGGFYPDMENFREAFARRVGLSPERIRLCCNLLSGHGGCNYSCYSAAALRDYAAEVGVIGITPTAKKECLFENTLCLCVKDEKI
ncbi:hypothetical protein FACS1894208_02160 [Clostridia bacterium]|nr:hypothetical protein FACS1894208_02160 [Clostridia bacterium]